MLACAAVGNPRLGKEVRLITRGGRAEALRDELGEPPEANWREAQERLHERACQVLGRERFEETWAVGRDLDFKQAAAQASLWLSELPVRARQ